MNYSETEITILWQDYRKFLQKFKEVRDNLISAAVSDDTIRAKNRSEILADIRCMEVEIDNA